MNDTLTPERDALLTPAEVADLFQVAVRTVSRWVHEGKLTAMRTPGGKLRFSRAVVQAHLDGTAERLS